MVDQYGRPIYDDGTLRREYKSSDSSAITGALSGFGQGGLVGILMLFMVVMAILLVIPLVILLWFFFSGYQNKYLMPSRTIVNSGIHRGISLLVAIVYVIQMVNIFMKGSSLDNIWPIVIIYAVASLSILLTYRLGLFSKGPLAKTSALISEQAIQVGSIRNVKKLVLGIIKLFIVPFLIATVIVLVFLQNLMGFASEELNSFFRDLTVVPVLFIVVYCWMFIRQLLSFYEVYKVSKVSSSSTEVRKTKLFGWFDAVVISLMLYVGTIGYGIYNCNYHIKGYADFNGISGKQQTKKYYDRKILEAKESTVEAFKKLPWIVRVAFLNEYKNTFIFQNLNLKIQGRRYYFSNPYSFGTLEEVFVIEENLNIPINHFVDGNNFFDIVKNVGNKDGGIYSAKLALFINKYIDSADIYNDKLGYYENEIPRILKENHQYSALKIWEKKQKEYSWRN